MPNLTEAVRRIMAGATRRAQLRGAVEVDPFDLLLSILEQESRGASLLISEGLAFEHAEAAWANQGDFERAPLSDDQPIPLEPRISSAVDTVVDAARRFATNEGRHTELGSEHLVLALTQIDSTARTFLTQRGITMDRLRGETSETEEIGVVPLPSDFSLDMDDSRIDRRGILRVLDAATNRASEGLRVAEDYARFVQDDAFLTRKLKHIRHQLHTVLEKTPLSERMAARDSLTDVGASVASPSADDRQTTRELFTANVHRAQEAVRSLEEFGRLWHASLGAAYERIRYELYTVEKCITQTDAALDRLANCHLYLLLTRELCVNNVDDVIRGASAGGVSIFQVREKQLLDRALRDHLRHIRELTRECHALLIVNDRPDLAVLCEADGVHIGQDELSVSDVRRIVGTNCLVGVSTHTIHQARQAVLDGADYLGVGPTFPSKTKTFGTFSGLDFVQEVASEIARPWFAIGGISDSNIQQVITAGAKRVAITAAICGAADPRIAAARLRDQLETSRVK